jgi:predicted  nucleic acid-binding Zn-ribbon protein
VLPDDALFHVGTIVASALLGIIGFLVSFALWFLKRSFISIETSIKALTDATAKLTTGIEIVNQRLNGIDTDIASAISMGEEFRVSAGKIAVLERDLHSCFRRVDELKEDRDKQEKTILLLRERTHFLNNYLAAIKGKLETAKLVTFASTYDMPK